MKKLILLICFITSSLMTWAIKANTTPLTIKQSDGTMVTVLLHGDEHFSWYTDLNGHLLERIGNDFRLMDISVETFFAQANAEMERSRARMIPIASNNPAYFPHVGSPKALVILVEFSDTTFSVSDPKAAFEQYLNGAEQTQNFNVLASRNYGSVRQYFSDISNGQFTPQFDIVGPITLPNTNGYYAADNGSYKDYRIDEMIRTACEMVDDSVDFSQYDNDDDGYVDLVYLIYAGYSQANGAPANESIWPKSGTTSGGTYDGKKVYRYGVNNELNYTPGRQFNTNPEITKRMNGIGVFCHEFSHTLGLPDLYPTVASAQVDNQALEYWDVMDGGAYVDNGYTPIDYTPWEKEVMEWEEIALLSNDTIKVTLSEDEAYKICEEEQNEYLILQNFQNNGWKAKMPGHGLLVYRIDYPNSVVNSYDRPNNKVGKPAITIVPADSLLITSYNVQASSTSGEHYTAAEYKESFYGDPYPGSQNVTTLPSVTMNNCTMEKPLYHIAEDAGNISFEYLKDQTATNVKGITRENVSMPYPIYTIDGRCVGKEKETLAKGVYLQNGKKIVVK